MMRASILILIGVVLAACSLNTTLPPQPPATPFIQSTAAPALPPADRFQIEAWVDNRAPARDSRVTVSGSLIKNGVRLGGMMMQATWPDKTQERGLPNCNVLVIYGSGVCAVDAGNYPPGVFVPITITFKYGGLTHIGHTGFTPQ
jgi:hypothetical protein